MRHFAEELRCAGVKVIYQRLDDQNNGGSLESELKRVTASHKISKLVVTMPGEYRLMAIIRSWQSTLGVAVELREDDRFLCSLEKFNAWAEGRRQLRMDFFYRDMRRAHNFLMDRGEPVGGKWNFDSDNREAVIAGMVIPPPFQFVPDNITNDVLGLVAERCADYFDDLDDFGFAVTREQAQACLGE